MIFDIKTSDTSPNIKYQLQTGDGSPLDLSGNNGVKFIMKPYKKPTPKIEAPADVLDETKGIVRYDFSSGDTDTTGTFLAEWEVEFANGNIETVPNSDYIKVRIVDDLA